MNIHPTHIADEFAEVFEYAYDGDEFDVQAHLRYRDDFYQLVRSDLANHVETSDEVGLRFQRPPALPNAVLMCFAAGNAEYYARILGIPTPSWCHDVPPLDEPDTPFFPFPRIIGELNDIIRNTPPELRERGFIYSEHNFEIY